jgi:hypothetical protein
MKDWRRRRGVGTRIELCPQLPRVNSSAAAARTPDEKPTTPDADGTSDPRADATPADIHLPAARGQPRPSLCAPPATSRRATCPVLHPETSPTPLHVARTQAFCATRSRSEDRPRRRSASCSREAWCARDSSAPTVQHDVSAAALATVRSWNSTCGSSDRPSAEESAPQPAAEKGVRDDCLKKHVAAQRARCGGCHAEHNAAVNPRPPLEPGGQGSIANAIPAKPHSQRFSAGNHVEDGPRRYG